MGDSTSNAGKGRLLGIVLIVATLGCWTTIPLYLRHLSELKDPANPGHPLVDPWTANGWRYGFSTLLWIPPLIWAWSRSALPKGLFRAALLPSIFNAAAQVCFGIAPYYISPGLMTFSLRLNIVFVTIGAAILFAAERKIIRAPGFLLGLGMLLLGTALTIVLQKGGLGGATGLGIAISFASAALYAAYALAVRKWMHGMPPLLAFAAVSQYTGLALVVLMLIFGVTSASAAVASFPGNSALLLSGNEFALLLIFAVVGIGAGHTLYFHSIQKLGLAVSAGVTQLQPITVSIGAIFVFPDKPEAQLSGPQWATGILAILGAVVMLVTQHKMAKADRKPIDEFDDLPVDEDVAMVAQSNDPRPGS